MEVDYAEDKDESKGMISRHSRTNNASSRSLHSGGGSKTNVRVAK